MAYPQAIKWPWNDWKERLIAQYHDGSRRFDAQDQLRTLSYDKNHNLDRFFESICELISDVDPDMPQEDQVTLFVNTMRPYLHVKGALLAAKPKISQNAYRPLRPFFDFFKPNRPFSFRNRSNEYDTEFLQRKESKPSK